MRDYELILIVHPDLDENGFNDVVNRVGGWITSSGGQVTKTELWGKRHLAYPIKKLTDGQYVLFHLTMAPSFGAELERNLGFLEPVLRFSLVLK